MDLKEYGDQSLESRNLLLGSVLLIFRCSLLPLEGDTWKTPACSLEDSVYQPGLRTGLCSKHHVNQRGEFVIDGHVPSHLGVDSIVVGFFRGKDLHYAARVRAGFVHQRQSGPAACGVATSCDCTDLSAAVRFGNNLAFTTC
jgi:hypothetical protein